MGGYADDRGFFYNSALDRYFQVTELGQIVSYTYAQFLTGNGGTFLGTVGGYANDRGFLYVPDIIVDPTPEVPLPAAVWLFAAALPLFSRSLLGRKRRHMN